MPAGEEAQQTAFESVPVPGYTHRADICAQALTLQLPLEGKLLRGGVTAVIKTADGQWIHCQQHGAAPDFFISTREVCPTKLCPRLPNLRGKASIQEHP